MHGQSVALVPEFTDNDHRRGNLWRLASRLARRRSVAIGSAPEGSSHNPHGDGVLGGILAPMATHSGRFLGSTFIPMAHRGGSLLTENLGIENTLPAFQNAVDLGYSYLETDVHATGDGELVAFHDPDLGRVTDTPGLIAELPFRQVRHALVGGREKIPTLDELLESFPESKFNVDMKAAGALQLLARAISRHNAGGRVCIGSFSGSRLRSFRRLMPRVTTSATTSEILLMSAGRVGRREPGSDVVFQVPITHTKGPVTVQLVTPKTVSAVHAAGRKIHVWTIDDAETMHRLLDLGVDGIITDRPDVLKAVLHTRGMWSTQQGT